MVRQIFLEVILYFPKEIKSINYPPPIPDMALCDDVCTGLTPEALEGKHFVSVEELDVPYLKGNNAVLNTDASRTL